MSLSHHASRSSNLRSNFWQWSIWQKKAIFKLKTMLHMAWSLIMAIRMTSPFHHLYKVLLSSKRHILQSFQIHLICSQLELIFCTMTSLLTMQTLKESRFFKGWILKVIATFTYLGYLAFAQVSELPLAPCRECSQFYLRSPRSKTGFLHLRLKKHRDGYLQKIINSDFRVLLWHKNYKIHG